MSIKYIALEHQNLLAQRQELEPDSQLYAVNRYGKIYTLAGNKPVEVSRADFKELFALDSATLDLIIRSRGKHQLVSKETPAAESAPLPEEVVIAERAVVASEASEMVPQVAIRGEDTGEIKIAGELNSEVVPAVVLGPKDGVSLEGNWQQALTERVSRLEIALAETNEALAKLVAYVRKH